MALAPVRSILLRDSLIGTTRDLAFEMLSIRPCSGWTCCWCGWCGPPGWGGCPGCGCGPGGCWAACGIMGPGGGGPCEGCGDGPPICCCWFMFICWCIIGGPPPLGIDILSDLINRQLINAKLFIKCKKKINLLDISRCTEINIARPVKSDVYK